MNLSTNYNFSPFAPFPSHFCATSWPTYLSMSCEAAQKSDEKFIKTPKFIIGG
jgi:hypothetical protein